MELQQRLLKSINPLTEAANRICTDKAFVYDTVYLAVIKTKQKYKKLANKERAVDVCISLMKQPRKHVKQNFSSVEDCIEKALAAKTVPWKPILSAVAVVLAVAMIVPAVLPDKVRTVDASGFVMEGAIALENLIEGSDIQLKNLHEPGLLGALDPASLPDPRPNGTENWIRVNYISHQAITTANGVTLYFEIYTNSETKQSECIVYEAHEDGWHEVGRIELPVFTSRQIMAGPIDGKIATIMTSVYHPSHVAAVADPVGNVYIMTYYRNGMQMHRYNADGSIEELDRIWMNEGGQQFNSLGEVSNYWPSKICAFWDESRNTIEIHTFMRYYRSDCSINLYQFVFLSFDLSTENFSEVTISEEMQTTLNGSLPSSVAYGGDGEYYMVALAVAEDVPPDENGIHTNELSLVHIKDGKVIYSVPVDQGNAYTVNLNVQVLEADNDGIHLVYTSNRGNYYVRYNKSGEAQERTRIYAPSTDPIKYLCFFRHEGQIYYLCYLDMTYLILAQMQEDGYPRVIGKYLYPEKLADISFFADERLASLAVSSNHVLNLFSAGQTSKNGVFPATYFLQIVLGENTELEES